MSGERWALIEWSGQHEISDDGQVRTVAHVMTRKNGSPLSVPAKLLKQQTNHRGYSIVTLRNAEGYKRVFKVHRLVLEHFVGECPEGMEGCHGPGGKADNSVGNLRWDTPSANQLDSVAAGTHNFLWDNRYGPGGWDYKLGETG